MNNSKQPAKKSKSSYSLLLRGLSEAEKSKPPKKTVPVKRPGTPESCNMSISSNNDYLDNPSMSNEKGEAMQEDPDIPDRSYGDYYCKLCDSHMNSDNMWEAHITGKRHIKNVKKGDSESKYDDLPDEESNIKYELRNVKDPIVGLSYIHEIRRKEPKVPPIYNCFLCHASIATVPLVTEHVISLKHRLNYMKENNPDEYALLEATNLRKGSMEPIVLEAARKMEQKFGRGTVKVKQEKKKDPVYTYSAKRSFNMDDDSFNDTYQKPSKNSRNESVWKSVGTGNNFGRERSRSPRNFDDHYKSPPRSRSPSEFRERKRRYSDEHSMDGYKRSFSKRSISPPRRELSPKYDYDNFRSNVEYPHFSRKSDSRDRMDYISPRYEHTSQQESVKRTYNSREHQQSASFMPQDSYMSSKERAAVDHPSQPRNPMSNQPRSFDEVLQDTLFLSSEECYKLFYQRLKSLPEVKDITEMVCLTKLIGEAQKKLKSRLSEEILNALINYQKSDTSSNIIPGLGDAMSSSAKSLTTSNSPKPMLNAASFLSDLFKNANSSFGKISTSQDKPSFPYPLPTSYAPAMSSQQSTPAVAYQVPPSNYQSSPANLYQDASTGSYPNQAPYQLPNANAPFASGTVQNFPQMSGLNPADKAPAQGRIFNYSHYSSTSSSSAPKNFPHKY